MDLTSYRPLGRSGLIVSPLALGTMTFGTGRWGADATRSRAIFNAYADAGGNRIDTADIYSGGTSEEMVGGFIADSVAAQGPERLIANICRSMVAMADIASVAIWRLAGERGRLAAFRSASF